MSKEIKFTIPEFGAKVSHPQEIMMALTNICNHRCYFCSYRKIMPKPVKMPREKARDFLKQALDLGAKQASFALLDEPFCSGDFENCVKDAKIMGYEYIYATTNGSLSDKTRLRKSFENGLDSIKFSINAGNRETYKKVHGRDDFDRVIQNVKDADLLRKEINPEIRLFVGFAENIINSGDEGVKELEIILNGIVDKIFVMSTYNQGGAMFDEVKQETVSKTDKIWHRVKSYDIKSDFSLEICSVPFRRAYVTSEGFLTACCVDGKNELVVADLNKTSLKDAWNSEDFQKFRSFLLNKNVPENCKCYNCINNTNNEVFPLEKILKGK
jgi:MoaA/NifB/PqqE/SkfB family radical SAM enzyme